MDDICDAQGLLDKVIADLDKQEEAFDTLKMEKLRDKVHNMSAKLKRANMYIDSASGKIAK